MITGAIRPSSSATATLTFTPLCFTTPGWPSLVPAKLVFTAGSLTSALAAAFTTRSFTDTFTSDAPLSLICLRSAMAAPMSTSTVT